MAPDPAGPPGANTPAKRDDTPAKKEETEKPEPQIALGPGGVFAALVIGGAVLAVLAYLYLVAFPAPVLVDAADPEKTSSQLGYYLARWGLALTLLGFVPVTVAWVLRTFTWKPAGRAKEAAETAAGTVPWDKLFEAIPGLIKTPVGIGITLILIGALLLVGGSVGSQEDPASSPSPSPTASP